MSDGNKVAIAILKDFVTALTEAGVSRQDAMKLAFDLTLELVDYIDVDIQANPPEALRRLKAAAFLKEAAQSFLR